MMSFEKIFKKEEEEPAKNNKTLEILLKIFLIVGIVAGVCVILKFAYDKYKKNLSCIGCCDDDDEYCDDILDECCGCCEDDDCDCCCDECDCEDEETEAEAEEVTPAE